MLELLRKYLRLMKTHDFSYHFIDDFNEWQKEDKKRIELIVLKGVLIITSKGRWFVKRAEKKYGYV